MKRAISLFLALTIILITMGISKDAKCEQIQYQTVSLEDFTYITTSDSFVLKVYNGSYENVFVPSEMTDENGITKSVALFTAVFASNDVIRNVYLDNISVYNKSFNGIFKNSTNLEYVGGCIASSEVSKLTVSNTVFNNCTNLKTIDFDMSTWTYLTTKQENQFANCPNLESITHPIAVCYSLESMFKEDVNLHEVTLNPNQKALITAPYDCISWDLTFKVKANTDVYRNLYMSASDTAYHSKIHIEPYDGDDNTRYIWCVGDSITAASKYVSYLYSSFEEKNDNITSTVTCAVIGDVTMQMAYRTGTYKMTVASDFEIPSSSNETVDISIQGEKGGSLPRIFPEVTIDGVLGFITRSGDGNSSSPYEYKFQRAYDGKSKIVSAGNVIAVETDISKMSTDDTLVIHAGTNDLQTNTAISNGDMIQTKVVNIINDMIEYAGTSDYIVCGITTADRYTNESGACTYYENYMNNIYGERFLNTREYFLENAYDITGLTPSDEDELAMENGQVPTVFKGDKLHLNEYGSKVVAKSIYDKFFSLGYDVKIEHIVEDVVTDPTCMNKGYTTHTCLTCGKVVIDNYVDKVDHDYITTVTPATCTELGTVKLVCKWCNKEINATYGTVLGHNNVWSIESGKPQYKCTSCSKLEKELPFDDILDRNQYFDYVHYCYLNGYLTGINETTFAPDIYVSRAMMVTILYRMAGSPTTGKNGAPLVNVFSDVPDEKYYTMAAEWAYSYGITTETKFNPNGFVTREQTASFMYRFAREILNEDVQTSNSISSFPDYTSVSSWAIDAMAWANSEGMITGTQQGYLNPKGTTKRIHLTKMIYNF